MIDSLANAPLAVPDRMWFVDTRMGMFANDPGRAANDNSAFAHWLEAGRMFLSPWVGNLHEYDARLAKMLPGDPVFGYENRAGVVAIGRVCDPKNLVTGTMTSALFPRPNTIVQALAVDWDTSVTRTAAQVWEVTNLGGPALKSCGPGTAFYPMAVEMLQEAHAKHRSDPDAGEAAALLRIRSSRAYSATSRTQVIEARVGQGRFRKAVLERERACRLTGVAHPQCLVASHIKPWAICTGGEHLDGANGLMLAPHADHLFDTGLISFEDNGDLVLSHSLNPHILRAWHIDADANVGPFDTDQAHYLAYHRRYVLGQPRPRRQRNLVGDLPEGAVALDTVPLLSPK